MICATELCSDASMVLKELQARLQENFVPSASEGLDATFCLAIATERLTFRIRAQSLEFINLKSSVCDATFYFENVPAADDLLCGRHDVLTSFMEGKFRADGYLMWAFRLMAMFRNTTLQRSP
ncbi:MAG: hypothetical protein IH908_04460 [Proteobacteria bacterium]|nr:hypothetical protein [Pseudomonadota bacterium]